MSRKATPDILGTLMREEKKQEDNIDGYIAKSKAIKQENDKLIKKQNSKAIRNGVKELLPEIGSLSKDIESGKEKTTFNLSKSILSELEHCWVEIRKLRKDKKVSRTEIVERAIEEALKEFKLKRESSKFYSILEDHRAIKR